MTYPTLKKPMPKTTFKDNMKMLQDVLTEQQNKTKILMKKHPWVPILTNWAMAILIIVLIGSLFVWRTQVKAEERAGILAAEAMAQYQAEQMAKEEETRLALLAEQNSENAKREADTILMAKLFAGIDNFVEKYGYGERDLRTYGECVINRVLNNKNEFRNLSTIAEVITQPNQWIGFSENNQVVDKYYKIASEVVNSYYDNAVRPCTSDYCWAELTSNGIYLKNEYNDGKYVSTWRWNQ